MERACFGLRAASSGDNAYWSAGSIDCMENPRWRWTWGRNGGYTVRRHVHGARMRSSRKKARVLAAVLEAVMLVCFGLSWPINALKAWKSRTAVGTSSAFLALITLGYVAGIAAKFVGNSINWVLIVYFINLIALAANWLVFARNSLLDRRRKRARAQAQAQ